MSQLAIQIEKLLANGLEPKQIAFQLKCAESYVRVIRSGQREVCPSKVRIDSRMDVERNPIKPPHAEKVAQLRAAGVSMWEIQQLLPHGAIHA